MTDLTILLCSYLLKHNIRKADLADHLNVSAKTLSLMIRRGVETWRWDEVIKSAEFAKMPIDVLREQIQYKKGKPRL